MQQSDTSNPYHQFYQPPSYNPSPNPNPVSVPVPIDPHPHASWPVDASYASAPPIAGYHSTSTPSSDHANYSSAGYPQTSNHVLNSISAAPTGFHYPYDQTQTQTQTSQPPYYSYDQNQPAPNYAPPPNPISAPPPHLIQSDSFGGYTPPPTAVPNYDTTSYALQPGNATNSWGGDQAEKASRFDQESFSDQGVYRYEGGNVEPYGARGTAGSRYATSEETLFDDYGRPIHSSKGPGNYGGSKAPTKIVKATPAVEDVKSGVQKFRVKILSEGLGQNDMDVLCQIGLDGIHLLDPATSRTLRIYSLDAVTRWEVLDSYIFAFWAKTSVDIEPKRIRLKSNSYTTNTILDTVTAASIQFKEIGDRKDYPKASAEQVQRKKSFVDWMNVIKPPNEEKDYWVPDESATNCTSCSINFTAFVRKHHCRNCGEIFCDKCTQGRTPLSADEQAQPVRVCDRCMAEVTQRLENSKAIASRSGAMRSHEDLAKRLKEEMSKNAKASSGSPSSRSHKEMQEVECPTCTVHLQVQVPPSGSETIECSVCQHHFLVSAN